MSLKSPTFHTFYIFPNFSYFVYFSTFLTFYFSIFPTFFVLFSLLVLLFLLFQLFQLFLHSLLVWSGLVWSGLVQPGLVWSGLVCLFLTGRSGGVWRISVYNNRPNKQPTYQPTTQKQSHPDFFYREFGQCDLYLGNKCSRNIFRTGNFITISILLFLPAPTDFGFSYNGYEANMFEHPWQVEMNWEVQTNNPFQQLRSQDENNTRQHHQQQTLPNSILSLYIVLFF